MLTSSDKEEKAPAAGEWPAEEDKQPAMSGASAGKEAGQED
jgi:hypothetical protein